MIDDATGPLVINSDADMKEAMSAETTASKHEGGPFRRAAAAIRVGVHRALATPPPYWRSSFSITKRKR